MTWTDPRTWVAGEVVTDGLLNAHVRDNLKAIGDARQTYTPVLSGWTLGNGTLLGYYSQAGKWITGTIIFTFGSTSTTSGNLRVSLPVPAAHYPHPVGQAGINDASAGYYWRTALTTTTSVLQIASESDARVTGTVPMTWATGDQCLIEFAYEAA